jgi:hypothetical protein
MASYREAFEAFARERAAATVEALLLFMDASVLELFPSGAYRVVEAARLPDGYQPPGLLLAIPMPVPGNTPEQVVAYLRGEMEKRLCSETT